MAERMPTEKRTSTAMPSASWVWIVLIIAVTSAVYSPVVHQGFFNWDDPKHVRAIWKPGWERAWRIVSDLDLRYSTVAYYIPLHFLTLMADQALLGTEEQPQAWISKVMNVAYHAANASLLFLLLLALGAGRTAALFGALIFAVHPLQVGTVAWVVERKNVLSTFFYLSALILFLRLVRTERIGCGVGVVALFGAGLLSKPSVVTLPLVMLATLFLFTDRASLRKKPLVVVGVTFLLAMAWGAYVVSTEVSYPGILPRWHMRPLLAAGVIWFYIAKFVYPHGLVVIYPRWDVASFAWEFLLLFGALVILAAAIAYAYRQRRMEPLMLWGLVFFLINVLPISGLAPFGYMGHSFVADHLAYLPLVGLAVVAAAGADAALAAIPPKSVLSAAFHAGVCALVLGLAVLSVKQVRLWQDPALLWEAALKVNKSSTALFHNYGALCSDRGQPEKALALFQEAAKLSPMFEASYNNMGRILLSLGRKDEARQMFEKSLEINPKGVVPGLMLARILREDNKPADSLQFLQKSVTKNPSNPALRAQLADVYRLTGREDQALEELDRAIQLGPLVPDPYVSKAYILLSRGHTDMAIALLRKALSLGTNADAHNMLGAALAGKGNASEALDEFLKAYKLDPNLAGLRDNIANALMDLQEFQKAAEFCSTLEKSGTRCSEATRKRLEEKIASPDKLRRPESDAHAQ
jgi:protein O-mannosyl-transferase